MNQMFLNKARREAQCCTYDLEVIADKTGDFVGYSRSGGPLSRVVALVAAVHAAGESTKITVKNFGGDVLCAQFTIDDTYAAGAEIDLSANIDYAKVVAVGTPILVDIDYTAGGGATPAAQLQLRVYTS